MASVAACRSLALLLVVVAISVTGAAAGSNKSLNITNHCSYTVRPGILSGSAAISAAALDSTGFDLAPGESRAMPVPTGWSGRVWGRTLCSTDANTGKFACVTGDCGSGGKDCAGGGPAPPATLAQFMLDGSGGMDWYGVSLVDGFNLLVQVAPQGAGPGGNCVLAECVVDLNAVCPAQLRVTSAGTGAVACKSACQAFESPQSCCTGAYGNPSTCEPTAYSQFFKSACRRVSSYAYDGAGGDTTGTYAITFCRPTMTSGQQPSTPTSSSSEPPVNGGGAASEPWRVVLAAAAGRRTLVISTSTRLS